MFFTRSCVNEFLIFKLLNETCLNWVLLQIIIIIIIIIINTC